MDSLRLILILVGAVIIVAVYLYSRYKKDSPKARQEKGVQSARRNSTSVSTNNTYPAANTDELADENGRVVIVDPSIYTFGSSGVESTDSNAIDSEYEEHSEYNDELTELGHDIKIEEDDFEHSSSIYEEVDSELSTGNQNTDQQDEDHLVEKVMVIYLLAQPGQRFSGTEISSIADAEGLRFGEDGYFHRHATLDDDSESIFGIANILEPGLFDLSGSEEFYTPGLVFFQRLSNTGGALEEFDNMLETVISFRDRLDGRLQDSGRRSLNKSAMIKLREQVAEFSRKNPVTPF